MLLCFLCFTIWWDRRELFPFPDWNHLCTNPGPSRRGQWELAWLTWRTELWILGVPAHEQRSLWLSLPPSMKMIAFKCQPLKGEDDIKMLQPKYFFTVQPVTQSAEGTSRKFCSCNTINIKTLDSNERKTKSLCPLRKETFIFTSSTCVKRPNYILRTMKTVFSASFLGRNYFSQEW